MLILILPVNYNVIYQNVWFPFYIRHISVLSTFQIKKLFTKNLLTQTSVYNDCHENVNKLEFFNFIKLLKVYYLY